MIVNVTYVYEASVVAPRKRNPQTREFVATIPVEIEEVTSAELPVAIRYEEKKSHSRNPGMVWDIRWNPERGHWQPDVVVEDARDEDADRPVVHTRDLKWLSDHSDARSPAVRGYHSDPFGLLDRSHGTGLTVLELDPLVSRVYSTTSDQRAAQVREKAAGMLLVDGVLHERTAEPVYKVSEPSGFGRRGERECYLYVERFNDGLDETHAAGSHYRADEREVMLAANKFGDDVEDSVIEVLIPEAVRAPLPEMALVDAAKKVADNLKDKIHEMDRDFFSTYADVRDTLTAYRVALANTDTNRSTPPEAGDLSARLQTASAVAEKVQPDHYRWMHDRVRKACERYDARALDFEMEAFTPTP